jgi:hypothetical protein
MPKAKWTVMVLMGANNLPSGEQSLTTSAKSDLAEMQAVGSVKNLLNIVVQIDQKPDAVVPGGPQRFKVVKGGIEDQEALPEGEGGSGVQNVLKSFVTWVRESKEYAAEHYLLVLWGHAYKLAFNRDPEDPEGLDFPDLADALRNEKAGKAGKIDIVGFDSCNVSLIEAAYQLRDTARYLVGSQFTDPLPGWRYDQILKRVLDDREQKHLTGHNGPKDFGRAIVSLFVRNYVGQASATMTMLDLSRVEAIGDGVDELANELALAVDDSQERANVDIAFQRSQVPVTQPSVDLVTLCWNLLNYSGIESVRVAAATLGDLLLRPADPFVVAHEKSDLLVAMLHGVSILAPNVMGEGFDFRSLAPKYDRFDLAKKTVWGKLVFALAEFGR